jgi:hypothetical protein
MSFARSLFADLLDKRLLPVVAVLAGLAVAIPLFATLTAGSSSTPPPAPTPKPALPVATGASPAAALQSIAGPGVPKATRYHGRELDPFRAAKSSASVPAATGAAPATTVKTQATTPAPSTTPKTTVKTHVTKPKTHVTKPKTHATKPKATPRLPKTPLKTGPTPPPLLAKLGPKDSYRVVMRVQDATGVHIVPSVTRLSALPSAATPLAVYLGVLKGGRAVEMAMSRNALVQGPGQCLPSVADCQVLELKPGQVELLAMRTAAGPIAQGIIAVTGVGVVHHSSRKAALKVRALEAPGGRALLRQVAAPVLAKLQYTQSLGAVLKHLPLGLK